MLVNMKQYYKASSDVRPIYNVGFPFDCMSGTYVEGIHGEMISLGGFWPTIGVAGPGNVNKSTVMHHFTLALLNNYLQAQGSSYDTEASASPSRWHGLAARFENIGGLDLIEEGRLFLTDCTEMYGDDWFEQLKKLVADKIKGKKGLMLTTPYRNKDGSPIEMMVPTPHELDSLSMFVTNSVQEINDKANVGDSGRNVVAMRSAGAKSQMLMEIPTLTTQGNIPMAFSAHVGKEIKIDAYAPSAKNLTFLKNGTKFKDVPEKFTFLMNTVYLIFSVEIMKHKEGGPEYPTDSDDKFKGDTDLQKIHVTTIRNKGMVSGIPFTVVISQREGVLPELTALELMKESGRFGLAGNALTFQLDLLPDVNLSRTTVRNKIDNSYKLRRAFEITGEMIQIFNFHDKLNANYRCSPKELYEQLKAKGYDWDRLLETRYYWTFEEQKSDREFLSTMDLLRMRAGEYHPWWYGPVADGTIPEVKTPEASLV